MNILVKAVQQLTFYFGLNSDEVELLISDLFLHCCAEKIYLTYLYMHLTWDVGVKCGHFISVFHLTFLCSKCTSMVIITLFEKGT